MRSVLAAVIALLSLQPALAADLIVGPGHYGSLAAAIQAAQPGDRILLAVDVQLGMPGTLVQPVDRALTIESMPGGPRRAIRLYDDAGFPATWPVTADATFRHVRIACIDPADGGRAGRLWVNAPGHLVCFDDVRIDDAMLLASGAMHVLAIIEAREVLMRNTTITAGDAPHYTFVSNLGTPRGTDGVHITADRLVMEDVVLRAGSSAIVTPFETVGPGGSAVVANVAHTVMTRCTLADGNGGYVEPPTGGRTNESAAGASTLGALAFSQDVAVQPGLDGSHLAVPTTARGSALHLGEFQAPLRASGGQLGGSLDIAFDPPLAPTFVPVGVVLGVGFEALGTPFGTLWTTPIESFVTGGPVSIGVPDHPGLVGAVVVSQAVLGAPLRLGNPSWVGLHR